MDVNLCSAIAQTFIIFIIFCSTTVYLLLRRNYGYWKKRGVPYEKPFLFFGNLSFVMRKSFWEYFNELRKRHQSDYVGIFLAWKPTLVVQTPELARKILVIDSENFPVRYCYSSYSADPLGSLNLFTVRNPIWTDMRHGLSPIFTSKRLKDITALMNINANELVQKIQRDYIDQNLPVNLKEIFSMYTSDTVGYTVFGIHVSALKDAASPLWFITKHMVKWTFWRGFEFTMIFFIPAVARILRLKFFSQPATEYVSKLFWNVVDERKKTGQSNDKDVVNHLLKLKANLKLPAEAGTQFENDLMMAQAAVFILGSIETSSTTITYCLQELAHHPNVQQRLYEEVDGALKRTGKEILEYEDLLELKYLTACINATVDRNDIGITLTQGFLAGNSGETLRKYAPVPHLDRVCNKQYKLTDEVTIEAGTPVFVNVLAIHYNERYYPEPELWRPERMATASDNDNLQFTFLPFGDGPRFCIGKRYGMMQIRTAIAQMIMKYKFEPAPGEPYQVDADPYSVILAPRSGGCVQFVAR